MLIHGGNMTQAWRRQFRSYLSLPGGNGNYASTADSSALDLSGDFDLRVRAQWTSGTTMVLASKWQPGGNQRSYMFRVHSDSTLQLYASTTGSDQLVHTSTATVSGTLQWYRAVLDADNGAGGRTVRFYTSSDGETWTQIGNAVTSAGAISLFNSSASLAVGAYSDGTNTLTGSVYRMRLANESGAIVANPRFDLAPPGAASFEDSAGNTWSIHGTAEIVGVG